MKISSAVPEFLLADRQTEANTFLQLLVANKPTNEILLLFQEISSFLEVLI
jgi:hypothetical protein